VRFHAVPVALVGLCFLSCPAYLITSCTGRLKLKTRQRDLANRRVSQY